MEFNTEAVLTFITKPKLARHQYFLLKEFINSTSPNALPPYQKVLRPLDECIMESTAEIELQCLLYHIHTPNSKISKRGA